MTVSSRALVELALLGPSNDRRQLQDSPILGDVWVAFAVDPSRPLDLLITPYKEQPAGPVAIQIAKHTSELKLPRTKEQAAQVAYLQGLVAARLFLEEVFRVVVPMTYWWRAPNIQEGLNSMHLDGSRLRDRLQTIIDWVRAENEDERARFTGEFAKFNSLDRYVCLAGIILWVARGSKGARSPKSTKSARGAKSSKSAKAAPVVSVTDDLVKLKNPEPIVQTLGELFEQMHEEQSDPTFPTEPLVWQVSLNRKAMPAVARSVPAVKGDAARTLFNVRCDKITWAVMDSGIDGTHPAFNDEKGKSRIVRAYDFSNIRKIVSLDNRDPGTAVFKERLDELLEGREDEISREDATKHLVALAEDAENDRPIHWEVVEKLIKIKPTTPPSGGHGTHVAGIIGAYDGRDQAAGSTSGLQLANGMCPDIRFYDFRVLAKTLEDTEFAIIAALQYIRYLNERHTYISVHGANLSLSIPHDVRNYACGRTPICNECERLVESGVVVVAAAGNLGYQSFETKEGSYEGYAAFSITDPGNADGVITVGATHRYRPHTYGVSFFSSRGPTGDGRLKPDLVAPGERIESALPDGGWGELDGTSMAAPHVSGAAAMLMARYTELIGEPRRIKKILCENATDLARERSFQGHGMLDVLRAFQGI
jgi:hypothetical protein